MNQHEMVLCVLSAVIKLLLLSLEKMIRQTGQFIPLYHVVVAFTLIRQSNVVRLLKVIQPLHQISALNYHHIYITS